MTPRRMAGLAALLATGFALALIAFRSGIGMHDEGLMLQWGSRIGDGQWPYRDFWSNYLPGQAVLQALLGDSLVTWRVVRAATGAIAALLVYLLVEREDASRRWALGAWLAAALALAWPLTPGPNASATLLALAALLAAPRRPALAGVLAGLAFVFRPELGVAAAAGVLIATGDRRARRLALAVGAATGAACVAPFWIAAPHEMLDQVVGFVSVQGQQRLPFVVDPQTADPNKVLERLFPVLLLASTAVWLAVSLRRGRVAALVPLVVVGALYLTARADEFHLVPLAVLLAAAAAAAGARATGRATAVTMGLIVGLIALHGADRIAGHARDAANTEPIDLPAAGGVRIDPAQARALKRLGAIVDARTREGDPVLVLPPRTDRVSVGAPLLYTLLRRTNPTRYDVMQPGIVTTAEVQREMLTDMRRARTRLVIRWLAPRAATPEDNRSGRSSGVRILDRAIARDYRPLVRTGDFAVLVAR